MPLQTKDKKQVNWEAALQSFYQLLPLECTLTLFASFVEDFDFVIKCPQAPFDFSDEQMSALFPGK